MTSTIDPPTRRSPWLSIILRSILALLFFLIAAGLLYENIAEVRDRRFNPMPGKLIDIGGYKLHIDCQGQGLPTVILDSGLGDSYISWRKVQPEIAKFTRVCSYDRAGLGYSDPSPHLRTSKVIAEELHNLIYSYSVDRMDPIVLVGHSMGGYDVRLYASLYRGQVAAMVLVDSSHPEQESRFPAALNDMQKSWLREAEFFEFTMPVGIPRLMGFCDPAPEIRAAECNFHTARETVAEIKAFSESAAQTAAAGTLGDIPLAVLSHDPDKPSSDLPADLAKPANDAWGKMQEELAHLSTRGTQTIASNSSHYIQLDRPDVVVDAVHRVVDEVRKTAPKP